MSDELYLTSLKLRQFRTFGELDIDLDPTPGVLVVQGSNGLGKSSLIHGIEWALTDRIDNFRTAVDVNKAGRYLCKWKKPAGEATSVGLGFSDGKTLTRSLATRQSAKSVLTGITDPAAYLKHPSWSPQIKDLSHYLLLTHFLAQTNLSRLTYRADAERFDILRDAARSDIEDQIAKALHGSGATVQGRAFKNVIERLEDEAGELEEALELEARAWREAQTAGSLDDEAGATLLERILDLLAKAGDRGPRIDDLTDLTGLSDRVDTQGLSLRSRRAELDTAARLRGSYVEATEGRAAAMAALAAVNSRLEGLPEADKQARTARQVLSVRQAAAMRARIEADLRLKSLENLADAKAKIAASGNHLQASRSAVSEAADRHRGTVRDFKRIERRAELVGRLRYHADALSARISVGEGRVLRLRALIDSHIRLGQASLQLRGLRAASPDAEAELAAAAAEVAVSTADVLRLEPGVTALREASDAISAAVISIVSNLPETACDCPVCATSFEAPDVLRGRATAAAARLAPELERQQQALDIARRRNASSLRLLERREAVMKAIEDAQLTLEAETAIWDSGLKVEGLNAEADLATLHLIIETQEGELATFNWDLARARHRIRVLTREGQLDYPSAMIEMAGLRDLALSALYVAERQHAELERSCESQLDRIAELTTELFGGQSVEMADLERAFETAAQEAKTASETQAALDVELANADGEVNRVTTERTTLDAERRVLLARVEEFDASRNALIENWRSLTLVGSIDDAGGQVLIEAERALAQARESFDEAEIQLANLRAGRVAWSRQQGHQAALSRLRKMVDAAANAPRDDLLVAVRTEAAKKRARLESVVRARTVAARASARITAELNEFNTEYIQPLGRLMTRINRSILCDPSVGIRFKVAGRKDEQASVKDGQQPEDLGDVDPMLVHSEGQMAALSVSLLCAASLTFPWSRWKALMLDDPLQHNDAIHASAFADFIANLVNSKGYQVILSSHDAAQAEFLQRKFAARTIPCKTVSLIGMGPKGVEEIIRGPFEGLRLANG